MTIGAEVEGVMGHHAPVSDDGAAIGAHEQALALKDGTGQVVPEVTTHLSCHQNLSSSSASLAGEVTSTLARVSAAGLSPK